ncbi:aldo/keto reductase [Clostridium culturomicium]|uniref:aldo/keto reductase n=1 Tax=Clostridium culturomicium TaxID=1499683 RepID=UPI003857D47B
MNRYILNDEKTEISGLSLGSWAFSGAKVWGRCNEDEAARTIDYAIEQGINLIDTAEGYGEGQAEVLLGRALEGKRHKVVLASKVHMNNMHGEDLIKACEESLTRLKTDYIDIYQIHWPNEAIEIDETLEAFEKLKRDGKILNVGVCNHGAGALKRMKNYPVVTNQMPYSLLWRVAEQHFNEDLKKNNTLLWAYSPLAQGLLSGKYRKLGEVPMERRNTRMYDSKWGVGRHTDSGFEEEIFHFLSEMHNICDATGFTMVNYAMQFLKTRGNVGSILVGARNVEQLKANIEAYNQEIPKELLVVVDLLSDKLKGFMGTNADLWENSNNGRGRIF